MNVTQACLILEIDYDEWIKEEEKQRFSLVKKQYHLLALKYHPDKNKDEDANQVFHEIVDAYEYLKGNVLDNKIPSYTTVLHWFLEENNKWTPILEKIVNVCESQAVPFINELSYPTFCIIYNLLTQYRHILYLSPFVYEKMEEKRIYWFTQGEMKKRKLYETLSTKYELCSHTDTHYKKVFDTEWDIEYEVETSLEVPEKDEKEFTLVLRPSLDDIYDQNVYRYTYKDEIYLIPLWHHEMIYTELQVKLIPNLPSLHYWIDEENNLHQKVEYTTGELWSHAIREECMEIFFGKKRFVFYPHELKMREYQCWIWAQEGISKINEQNIYDISKKGDVILHIFLTGSF